MSTLSLYCESSLTDRYQTTVPATVREVLHLNKRDKIQYVIQPDNNVLMFKSHESDCDPVLEEFLTFLADDISKNPHRLTSISTELVDHLATLINGVEVDLDAPLPDEDE